MSWITKFFKNQRRKQMMTEAEARRYANSIVTSVFNQTYQYQGSDTPIYDLQQPEKVLEESFLSCPDVFSLVQKIYGMAQNANLKVYQKNGNGDYEAYKGQNTEHYNSFLIRPSMAYSFDEFLQQYFTYTLVLGNVFWNSVKYDKGAKKGLVSQVVPMYSQYVNPITCLLYTSPSPRDRTRSRMPSSA